MGSRSSFNGFCQEDLLVDRLLGDSYKVVEFVARNIEAIRIVAEALESEAPGKPLIDYRMFEIEGNLGALNVDVTRVLPLLVPASKILKVDTIVYQGTVKHLSDPYVVRTQIVGENIVSRLVSNDAALVNAAIKWIVLYKD